MNRNPWTEEDINELESLRKQGLSIPDIAKKMGRTYASVDTAIYRYGLNRKKCGTPLKWTASRVKKVRHLRDEGMTVTQIAERMGVSYSVISYVIRREGIKTPTATSTNTTNHKYTAWSEQDVSTLRRMRNQGISISAIAKQIGRSYTATKSASIRYQISKKIGARDRKWTPEVMADLRRLRSEGMTLQAIAEKLGSPFNTIRAMAYRHRIKLTSRKKEPTKTDMEHTAWIAEVKRRRRLREQQLGRC